MSETRDLLAALQASVDRARAARRPLSSKFEPCDHCGDTDHPESDCPATEKL